MHQTSLRFLAGALLVSSCQPVSPNRPQSQVQEPSTTQPDGGLSMSPIPPPAQVARLRVPQTGCFQERAPELSSARSDTKKLNQAAYQAELRRRGLAPLSLGSKKIKLHDGIRGNPTEPVAIPQNMVAGPQVWSGAATSPARWEFVRTRAGSVYRVVRIQRTARTKNVVLCGCQQRKCGPHGMGCPACGATTQTLYGPLPAGTTFEGELKIPFNGESLRISREQGACSPQRACPAPPPSMRRGPRRPD